MRNATVRGSEVKPGQDIKSTGRWYTVLAIRPEPHPAARDANVLDSKGRPARLLVFTDSDYETRAPRKPAAKKITKAKAARLVAIIAELQECEDITNGLRLALDDARAEIDPWCGD